MIAPLDVCPSGRLPVMGKTFAPQDVCPSVVCPSRKRRLPLKTFARWLFARLDVCPSVVCPSRKRRSPVKTENILEVRTGKHYI